MEGIINPLPFLLENEKEESKMVKQENQAKKTEGSTKIDEFKNDQERRQALVDCTDIMLKEMSKSTKDKMHIERFLLAKTLHNEILAQMSNRDRG